MGQKQPFKSSRRTVIADRIHPRDFHEDKMMYACEQCTHFKASDETCTLGFPAHLHLKRIQLKRYEITGHMSLCRFLEID